MKKLFSFAVNLSVMVMLFVAAGFSPVVGASVAVGGSLLFKAPQGVTLMAIQKEIWASTLVENLFADNTFLSKAFNASEWVNGRKVHVPNAGNPPGVVKNRKVFPAQVNDRTDIDLEFEIDEYTTDPVRIPNADTVELSYNKRESVTKNTKDKLRDEVAMDVLYKWAPTTAARIVATTGADVAAYLPSATGNRKGFVRKDVSTLQLKFNKDRVPTDGRYLLVDADMYQQLVDDMTDAQANNFLAQADLANGIVGKLYGFNIMMRSEVLRLDTGGALKTWDKAGAAGDIGAGLAWHTDSVAVAVGDVDMFENEKDATMYGDIISALVRAGGSKKRSDGKGLYLLKQG